MIDIDYRLLETETLDTVLSEIVIRQGAEYGETDISHETRCDALRQQLDMGKIRLVFYPQQDYIDIQMNQRSVL